MPRGVSVLAPIVVFVACLGYGRLPPPRGGFNCHDETIRHERAEVDTFPTRWLLVLALVPIVVIVSTFNLDKRC